MHDSPGKRQQDKIERDNLRYNSGYTVVNLSHDENWLTKLNILASL
ncbi:DEAD DEAH box helicase [Nostoc sphaeroides CCNUC1]|uniref:DEAD DEAH box helicase n=1 Tax=Nostoc sphaeroides CCNUC1 TaxID=2653204 RepID=A0A5P8WAN8_9NOSO|nr:DEAD DEAH box helicase [Nostoc sphaeroides CCNUC1]